MFMGEYNHSIDAKGRIIVPSKFREQLGDRFVVSKGLDRCLWVFPKDEWELFSSKLRSLPTERKDARKLVRFFMSGAIEVDTDKQGRVLLSQALREHAKLDKDVVLTGMANRVEIWDKKTWEDASTFDDMDEIAEHMGEWGIGI